MDDVITARDVSSIYELPLSFREEKLDDRVCTKLNLKTKNPDMKSWKAFVRDLYGARKKVCIGLVGKYVDLKESYKSLNEALVHAAVANGAKLEVRYLDSEKLEKDKFKNVGSRSHFFEGIDAILIPGGFGNRGVEGKIRALEYGRVNGIPCFGICLGMQLMAVEFARHVLKIKDADSAEFSKKTPKNAVIHFMPGQKEIQKGGSMRLGAYECQLTPKSLAYQAYKSKSIHERHRHRLEFNNKYRASFEKSGMQVSGLNPQHNLVEMIELAGHPWYLGCQFHPEFKSRPVKSHPLFKSFIKAALSKK